MRKTAPGKNGASTKPRKKRTAMRWLKRWVAALQVETAPQRQHEAARYSEGRTRVMSRLDGSCMSR
jgi:hypothetical protein